MQKSNYITQELKKENFRHIQRELFGYNVIILGCGIPEAI